MEAATRKKKKSFQNRHSTVKPERPADYIRTWAKHFFKGAQKPWPGRSSELVLCQHGNGPRLPNAVWLTLSSCPALYSSAKPRLLPSENHLLDQGDKKKEEGKRMRNHYLTARCTSPLLFSKWAKRPPPWPLSSFFPREAKTEKRIRGRQLKRLPKFNLQM